MNKSILSFEKERILVSCTPKDEQTIPQPILSNCFRIETIPYTDGQIYGTPNPLDEEKIYIMNEDFYSFIRGYISINWPSYWYEPDPESPSYNPEPQGWVYLESIDTEISSLISEIEGSYTLASVYTLSARIVFYSNNNLPSLSPSGV